MNIKQTEERNVISYNQVMETLLEFSHQKEQLIAGEEMDAYSFSHEALDCAARNIFEQFKDWHNALSLPSKPVGDVEEMAETYSEQKAVISFDSDDGHAHFNSEEIIKAFKSGYAAAPQKGMEKYSEDAPDKAYLAFKKHFPTGSGEFMTTWINGYVAAIRDAESESPSPSEAGDGWISVSSLKKLITNMKDKNFLESVIIEEVERNLDNPERLHKVFPPSNP